MKEQFIIYFKDEEDQYQAEVKAFELDNSMVYDVYYSLVPHVYLVRRMQIYAAVGNGSFTHWRQRITNKDEKPLPEEFVEAIGSAIENAQL